MRNSSAYVLCGWSLMLGDKSTTYFFDNSMIDFYSRRFVWKTLACLRAVRSSNKILYSAMIIYMKFKYLHVKWSHAVLFNSPEHHVFRVT